MNRLMIVLLVIASVLIYAALTEGAQVQQDPSVQTLAAATATAAPAPASELEPVAEEEPAALIIQYRGGANPCRFLFRSQRLGLFTQTPILIDLVGTTSERQRNTLMETNETHLIGLGEAHTFTVVGPRGDTVADVAIPAGETIRAVLQLPEAGLYSVFDRENPQLGKIAEIHARPQGQPGGGYKTGWCSREESAPPTATQ